MKLLKNLKISQRLGLAFALMLSLLLAVVGTALYQAHMLHTKLNSYTTDLVPSVRTIHTILEQIGDSRRHETQHLLSDGWAEMAEMESRAQQDRLLIEQSLQSYGTLVSDPQDLADYESVQALARSYWQLQDQVLQLSRQKVDPAKRAAGVKLMMGDSRAAFYRVNDAGMAWAKHNEDLGNAQVVSGEQIYHNEMTTLILLALGGLGVGASAAFFISRSITRPLTQAVELAQAVAHGDLSRRSSAAGSDEIGGLLRAMDEMSGQLAGLISDVYRSAEAVNGTAREISQSNEQLSQRTQQQAMSLQETASSMEEITSIGRNNAGNAGNADKLARDAQNLAESGGAVVSQAASAMSAITQCSAKISSIISVIDEIAFQTNLLALNAAVEAARAGDQGRGFAVVAAEVRALAQRSADAAKQIKALIVDSAEKVRAGTQLVDRSGQSLSEILKAVRQMTGLISEIAAWSQEQSEGVVRVNEAILHLDGATQKNAALVEEGAAASRTLQTQADVMTRRASFFRTDANPRRPPDPAAQDTVPARRLQLPEAPALPRMRRAS